MRRNEASQTEQVTAETVVQDYIAVYNTHDLDASTKKIAPDIVISSPLLAGVRGIDAHLLPTGRRVEFGLAGFFRVDSDGLIARKRYYYDRMALLQQLNS